MGGRQKQYMHKEVQAPEKLKPTQSIRTNWLQSF